MLYLRTCAEKITQIHKNKQKKRNRAPGCCDLLLLNRLRGTSRTLPESGFLLSLFNFAALEVVSYGIKILERKDSRKSIKLIRNLEFMIYF